MNLKAKAKQVWPGLSQSEMNTVLWACTTYPVGDEDRVLGELRQAFIKSGGDVWHALNQADEARTAAMMQHGR